MSIDWRVRTLGEYVATTGYDRCKTCGQRVYNSARQVHDKNCQIVFDAWGTPEEMLALWRADPTITVATLMVPIPGVAPSYMVSRLHYAGMERHELANRYGGAFYVKGRPRKKARKRDPNTCKRCEVLLSVTGRADGRKDLCPMCAQEIGTSRWKEAPAKTRAGRTKRQAETAG